VGAHDRVRVSRPVFPPGVGVESTTFNVKVYAPVRSLAFGLPFRSRLDESVIPLGGLPEAYVPEDPPIAASSVMIGARICPLEFRRVVPGALISRLYSPSPNYPTECVTPENSAVKVCGISA
jgi:hypothetical protein